MESSADRSINPARIIRAVTNVHEQEAETYRYWQSRTTAERMAAIDEMV